MRIVPLELAPTLVATAADRIWAAWWRDAGYPLAAITERLAKSLGPDAVPTSFVALAGDTFLGTVSLIASDLEERPGYTPWIAALWVEPDWRRRGIGAALVAEAAAWAADHGIETVHLAAEPYIAGWYERLGWHAIEHDVGGLTVLIRPTGARHSPAPGE